MWPRRRSHQVRLIRGTWGYRIKRLHDALGWSWPNLGKALGMRLRHMRHIIYHEGSRGYATKSKKRQPLQMLQLKTIKKILDMEYLYGDVIRRFDKAPRKWDRSWWGKGRRKYGLKPIKVRGQDYRDALEVLGAHPCTKDQERLNRLLTEPERRRKAEGYAKSARTISQNWAKMRAEGWDWHKARERNAAGRPYYRMGRKRMLDKGIPLEEEVTHANKHRKRWLIEAEKKRKEQDNE